MGKFIDLTGQKFGKLTVDKYVGKDKWGHSRWSCKCDCENETIVLGKNLKRGNVKSCGCLVLKHGHTRTGKQSKTYMAWHDMLQRCNNPNKINYKDYGGRDKPITVCERWSNKEMGFKNFLEDVGKIPKNLTIDRINNEGNYEPNNWKLSTMVEQSKNKRNNIMIPLDGKFLCLKDYCKEKNLNYNTISNRINESGWSIEKALNTPIRKYKRRK